MKLFDCDIEVGDGVVVGGLTVFPLTSVVVDGPLPHRTGGVRCAVGDVVVGLDLFDRPSTLGQYLRGIIAGHALDAPDDTPGPAPLSPVARFLEQVDATDVFSGHGVGLGEEVLLRGGVAGIGLSYDERLVHLAAFPSPV